MLQVRQLFLKKVGPFDEQIFDFSIEKGHPNIHIFTGTNGTGKTTLLHAIASAFDYFENEHKEHISNNFVYRFHTDERDEEGESKSCVEVIFQEESVTGTVHKAKCFKCPNCKNLHQTFYSESLEKKTYSTTATLSPLKQYQEAMLLDDISKQTFSFAAFGYSGYRLIKSAPKVEINNEEKFNPLKLALEFVKERDSGFLISNWLISTTAKAAIEESLGNKDIAKKLRKALDLFKETINNITGGAYSFTIQTNPWKVLVEHYGKTVEFDVLPDGLRSLMSWLGDLLMRLDSIPWKDKSKPVNEQNIILLLDEIEVHLHPRWQYDILPMVLKIFPNAQIFASTHSPFIINSIDNAKIYRLSTENGKSFLDSTVLSNTGDSYRYVYEEILGVHHLFSSETSEKLNQYFEIEIEILNKNFNREETFKEIVNYLMKEGEEVQILISSSLSYIKQKLGKDYIHG